MRLARSIILTTALVASVWAQQPPPRASITDRFQQFDRDGDGKLTRDEIPRLFDHLDKNKDGVVTREEAQAGMAQRRPQATTQPATPSAPVTELVRKPDIRYATMDGVDAKSQSLDVYAPKDAKNTPVVIFIHGGGWRNGDKSNPGVGSQPAAHFCAQGFVFVSINYRLTPAGKHPANIQDVAKAVAWVHNHIAEHGGDPAQINIMGHSAGAHLTALVAADDRWLKAEGKPLSILKRAVLLDTAAYDIPRYMKEFAGDREGAGMQLLYTSAFGDTEQQWRDASPQAHLAPGKHIPPMLLFFTGSRMAANTLAPAFAEALTKAGAPSRAVDTITLTHNEIGTKAADKDHPLGQLVLRFLRGEDVTKFPAKLAAAIPSPDRTDAPPGPAPAPPPVSASHALTDLRFTRDCEPGTKDDRGQWIAGTETMRILQHQGKLFASTGVWTDTPYFQAKGDQPWTGPQVMVKDAANAPWRVDMSFPKAIRVDCLSAATFSTDGSGRKLDLPVTLLIACPSSEDTATWTRDDVTGKWTESVARGGLRGGLRSLCTHVDAVTKTQHLFGGSTKSGSIFRADYDAAAPGTLRWHEESELSGTGRVMCMAEANGVLYAACGIKSAEPQSGGLFRRVDGDKPRWELLWRWPHLIKERGDETEILRGLTVIPDPKGGTHQVLLGTCNYPGVVYRIDPNQNHAVTTELDIRAYFAKAFGVSTLRGPCLSAYNNFLPVTDPDSGEKLHLLGLWINHPAGRATDEGSSAWYLVRHSDGTYGHGRVFDPKQPKPNPPRGLLATRTIEVSPFPDDKGRVLYFGGFDCANIESHNTAWIYKGVLPNTSREKP